jgi:hypothetical protein
VSAPEFMFLKIATFFNQVLPKVCLDSVACDGLGEHFLKLRDGKELRPGGIEVHPRLLRETVSLAIVGGEIRDLLRRAAAVIPAVPPPTITTLSLPLN